MKRFYKRAEIPAGGGVLLDGRPVRTPARELLVLPNAALAEAVADEWRAQGETIDPRGMPLTGLANAAIDRVAPDLADFAAGLARYAETDLLCYRAEEPPALVALQAERWDPILDWARRRYDAGFILVRGIMHRRQPDATLERLGEAVRALGAFDLAALSPVVTISGSLVIALAVLEGEVAPGPGFAAAHLDELWQAEMWGEDDVALQARAAREREFLAACRFLALLGHPVSSFAVQQ